MPSDRRDELTLIQIVERCEQVARAVASTTSAELSRLTEDLRSRHPEVPWRGVIAQRNFLAHAYDRVDFGVLWRNVTQRVPELRQQVLGILRSEFPLAAQALDERRTE